MHFGKKPGYLIALLFFFCCVGECWGYVLCPAHILKRTTDKTNIASGFKVQQVVGLQDIDCQKTGEATSLIHGSAWYRPPGSFRTEVSGDNGRRIYISDGRRALVIAGGEIMAAGENNLMFYHRLLVFQEREALGRCLEDLGVDMTVSSLGRYDDDVAYVIGAVYPDPSASQLWVNKENFLPLRLIVNGSSQQGRLEARYKNWQQQYGFWYPRRIEIYQKGKLRRVVCAESLEKKRSFKADFFDIKALENAYPRAVAEEERQPEDSYSADDVEKTIDEFRKLYQ